MKKMRRLSDRRLGMWWMWPGALLATSLVTGCTQQGEPTNLAAALENQGRARAQLEETPRPRLESLTATPLEEDLSQRTKSLLEVTLAEGQEKVSEVPMTGDDGEPLLLRDDGRSGDTKAGDGIFSAIGMVDFDEHWKTQERIIEFQDQQRDPLLVATFDNRVMVDERPLEPLPAELFRPFNRIPIHPSGISIAISPSKSLIITHPNVVNDPTRTYDPCTNSGDPNGVWTFNHLMTEMANQPATGITPAAFTRHWLQHWEVNQTLNAWTVPARLAIQPKIINPWPLAGAELDMTQAPFKLVAIVNRLDLGKGQGSYGSGGAGELRFVFAAVDRSAATCTVQPFLVIFEYKVPRSGCPTVKSWAQAWAGLSAGVLGSSSYNAQLESLTEEVVVRNAAPTKPNGSAISQIRTNEIMLASPWELREFRLFASGVTPNQLSEHTVALTAGDARNNTSTLASYINTFQANILANNYTVPLDWPATANNFLGANPRIPFPTSASFWNAPGILNNDARHKFSLNSCNGCHGRETSLPSVSTAFTHIDQNGNLSQFLGAGMSNINNPHNVPDPVSGVTRQFFEMRDRAQHLDSVAHQSCLIQAFEHHMFAVH